MATSHPQNYETKLSYVQEKSKRSSIAFKGRRPSATTIKFNEYSGPCQKFHRSSHRQLPHLVNAADGTTLEDIDRFVGNVMKGLDNDKPHKDDGKKPKAALSYGTSYVCNFQTKEVHVDKFDELAFSTTAKTGKIRGKSPAESKPTLPQRTSFIPVERVNIEEGGMLKNFMHENGFQKVKEKTEYWITFKEKLVDKPKPLEYFLILDGDFSLKKIKKPEDTWSCVTIISPNKSRPSYRPYDCRFKIKLYEVCPLEELRTKMDYFCMIEEHKKILVGDKDNIRGVRREFKERVVFLRKKHITLYKKSASPDDDENDDLPGMSILINEGTVYSDLSEDGTFQCVDGDRVEVTVLSALPDTSDEDNMEMFLRRIWTFAETFESVL